MVIMNNKTAAEVSAAVFNTVLAIISFALWRLCTALFMIQIIILVGCLAGQVDVKLA